jgi:hypothetical protein
MSDTRMDFASAPARSACGVITSGAAACTFTVEVPEAKLPKLLRKF